MRIRLPVTAIALWAMIGMLAACQPIQPPAESALPTAAPQPAALSPAIIVLPDDVSCLHAGTGATLAFDGQRLNYTCGDPNASPLTGLIGDVGQPSGDSLAVEKAIISHSDSGFTLDSSEELTFRVNFVDLADGASCAFAGEGATLAFDGKRLNYTCGDPLLGLIGDLVQEEGGLWLAEKAIIGRDNNGFVLESSEMAPIAVLDGTLREGSSAGVDTSGTAVVDGVVTYLVRMALPPNAVVTVKLVDVSRADAPATVLSEQVIETQGRQVPIPFELPYEPAAIDERNTYAVQARIEADGRLLFISQQQYPVITRGNPTTVEVLVQQP